MTLPHSTPEESRALALRRRQARGLLWLGLLALLVSLTRAGWRHVFTPGWWRLW